MLRKIWDNRLPALIVLLLVCLLALIRIYEDALFYDPFAYYFRGEYLNLPFPDFNSLHLFWGLGTRYWLNTGISLCIIFVLFRDEEQLRFASALYFVFFVILMSALLLIVNFSDSHNNFILFYVRRFLAQPVFLLLFLPAFYYQRRTKNNIP